MKCFSKRGKTNWRRNTCGDGWYTSFDAKKVKWKRNSKSILTKILPYNYELI